MITDLPSSSVPTEISENIDKVHTSVEQLHRELAQAQEVWQTTLVAEKNHFDELLKHKELAWREQEDQWAKQTQAYEARLESLKSDFESRLKQNEQLTAHALSELDDAWQRDKLEWGPSAGNAWRSEKQAMEEKITSLQNELAEKDRSVQAAPSAAAVSDAHVEALQSQLRQFQTTVASFQDRETRSDELVSACMQALDYQISVLYDLVHHYASEQPKDSSAGGDDSSITLVEP